MEKEVKFSIHVDNSELAGYFEAFLEDFKTISTEMLSAVNTDRGATLKIPDADYNRIKRISEDMDILAKSMSGINALTIEIKKLNDNLSKRI